MKNPMEYKGYYGSVQYDEEGGVFFGKVESVRALISYESRDAKGFRKAFVEAIDDYLETCAKNKIVPEKPFKGSFNVRVGSETHRKAALAAMRKGISLNRLVAEALEKVAR